MTQLVSTTTEVSHVPVTQDTPATESPALVSKTKYVVCTASSTLNYNWSFNISHYKPCSAKSTYPAIWILECYSGLCVITYC